MKGHLALHSAFLRRRTQAIFDFKYTGCLFWFYSLFGILDTGFCIFPLLPRGSGIFDSTPMLQYFSFTMPAGS